MRLKGRSGLHGASRLGSECEGLRHLLCELVLANRGVDLARGQFEVCGLLDGTVTASRP